MTFLKTLLSFTAAALLLTSCKDSKKNQTEFTGGITVQMNAAHNQAIVHVTTEDQKTHKKDTVDFELVPLKYEKTDSTVSNLMMPLIHLPNDSLKERLTTNHNKSWIVQKFAAHDWASDNLTLIHKNSMEPIKQGHALLNVAQTIHDNTGEMMSRKCRDSHGWPMVMVAIKPVGKLENK